MTILRVRKKQNNFVFLDKGFLQDTSLSLKAKGLLAYLLSLPDPWKIYLKELQAHHTDGRESIQSGIKELIKHRYVVRDTLRVQGGQFGGNNYLVYEVKQKETSDETRQEVAFQPQTGFPYTDNPDPVKPHTENPHLLNNKVNNNKTNKQITANKSISTQSSYTTTSPKVAAADISFPPKRKESQQPATSNSIIGPKLNSKQLIAINEAIVDLAKNNNLEINAPQELFNNIKITILDKMAFTNSGTDFYKKLNTIKKAIRYGKYELPLIQDKACAYQQTIKDVKKAIDTLFHERSGLELGLQQFTDTKSELGQATVKGYKDAIKKLDEQIQLLSRKIQTEKNLNQNKQQKGDQYVNS
jgi:hypothetical protein